MVPSSFSYSSMNTYPENYSNTILRNDSDYVTVSRRRNISEDSKLQLHHCDSLKPYTELMTYTLNNNVIM